MRAPISWLTDYVAELPDPDEIARRLTMAGLEVESVERPDTTLVEHLRVARIESVARHPDADRLSLCRVDDGSGLRQIVCGASNMKAGDAVVLATPGAVLPGGTKIKKSRIRGCDSEGMLCSAAELGLEAEETGILILDPRSRPGESAARLFGWAETVLDIAVTPNRGDCLSIRGLARELAAVLGKPLRDAFGASIARPSGTSRFRVRVEAAQHCPLYRGLELRGVTMGPSPDWLRARLSAVGVRPINVVVDVTNYVLIDRGQPLHAFDAEMLAGDEIIVRAAGRISEFETLDGQVRKLLAHDLVIADARGPIALAGVMGGARTAVHAGTTRLFLEAAQFRPATVRAVSRRLGLVSESSIRFERGIDPSAVDAALLQAAHMIVDLARGEIVGGIAAGGLGPEPPVTVHLRAARVARILGRHVDGETVDRIVHSLGASVEAQGDDRLLRVPTHRHDLNREIDWIEEIARLVGYDSIPDARPVLALTSVATQQSRLFESRARERLAALGLTEIVGLAFCTPERNAMLPGLHSGTATTRVRNPLRSDASELRRSLLGNLVDAHAHNLRNGARTTDLYALGRTFSGEGDVEIESVAGLLWGPRRARGPGDAGPVRFWDVKAAVESVASVAGLERELVWRPCTRRREYHPRDSAVVALGGEAVGYAGRLHPDVSTRIGLADDVYVFEIDSRRLASYAPAPRAKRSIGRFPGSRRDVSLLVPDSLLAGEVMETIRGLQEPLVDDVWVFDEYAGEGVPAGARALAFAIVYRAEDRTLTDDEVAGVHERVVGRLCKALDVKPRI